MKIKVRLIGELAAKYGDFVTLEFKDAPTLDEFLEKLSLVLGISKSIILRDYIVVINGRTNINKKITPDDDVQVLPIFFGG